MLVGGASQSKGKKGVGSVGVAILKLPTHVNSLLTDEKTVLMHILPRYVVI